MKKVQFDAKDAKQIANYKNSTDSQFTTILIDIELAANKGEYAINAEFSRYSTIAERLEELGFMILMLEEDCNEVQIRWDN